MLNQPQPSLLAVFIRPAASKGCCPPHKCTQGQKSCPVPTPGTPALRMTLKLHHSPLIPKASFLQTHTGAVKWGYLPKTGYSTIQYLGSDPVQGQDVISKLSFIPYWSCCICQWTADVSTGMLPTILSFPMTAFHSIKFYNRHVYKLQRHTQTVARAF